MFRGGRGQGEGGGSATTPCRQGLPHEFEALTNPQDRQSTGGGHLALLCPPGQDRAAIALCSHSIHQLAPAWPLIVRRRRPVLLPSDLPKPLDRPLESGSQVNPRPPVQVFLGQRDVGAPPTWIVDRKGPINDL